MKKYLSLIFTLALAGGVFAQEYKIFYSGTTQGVVTITKDARGRITIIPQVTGTYYIPPGACPILPEHETGIYRPSFTKDIVIDGNTKTWTDSEDGSWAKTVFDGNTTRLTTSNGSWTKTVIDGNTTTSTSSNGSWEKIVIDGNTTTMTDSYGQWEKTVIDGNTTTVSHSNGNLKKIVVDGNTTTTFYSGSEFAPAWWSKISVVDKQGYNIYIEYTDINYRTLTASGQAHYDQKNYDQAIADFTEALRLDPRHVVAYVSRGNVYLMKGDRARARADWSRALEINPNSTAARNNLEKFK